MQPIRSITIITHITASPTHYPAHLTHPSDPPPIQSQPLTLRRWDTRMRHPHR
ncbi:hypothetical protein P692DRAFT_20834960 [Suillus brevipes Sb2]|nr:hypothetical protein P692DRAFT_20834960 [Suillus brevipes Sb2]